MWADIARDNAGALIPALEAVEARLRQIRDCIENGRHAQLLELLVNARAWHQQSP
jgi:prephenate dehydrogenase